MEKRSKPNGETLYTLIQRNDVGFMQAFNWDALVPNVQHLFNAAAERFGQMHMDWAKQTEVKIDASAQPGQVDPIKPRFGDIVGVILDGKSNTPLVGFVKEIWLPHVTVFLPEHGGYSSIHKYNGVTGWFFPSELEEIKRKGHTIYS